VLIVSADWDKDCIVCTSYYLVLVSVSLSLPSTMQLQPLPSSLNTSDWCNSGVRSENGVCCWNANIGADLVPFTRQHWFQWRGWSHCFPRLPGAQAVNVTRNPDQYIAQVVINVTGDAISLKALDVCSREFYIVVIHGRPVSFCAGKKFCLSLALLHLFWSMKGRESKQRIVFN
jgi:hypothetical protein